MFNLNYVNDCIKIYLPLMIIIKLVMFSKCNQSSLTNTFKKRFEGLNYVFKSNSKNIKINLLKQK